MIENKTGLLMTTWIKLLPKKNKLSNAFQKNTSCLIKGEDVTCEILERSYIDMAHIVKAYGDHYRPISERFHQEIEIQKKKDKMLGLRYVTVMLRIFVSCRKVRRLI